MDTTRKLVVIGAGPKALNILARAESLRKLGWQVPEILVIEKYGIGANWTGENGYTDGDCELFISPHKVFNYPARSIFGQKVVELDSKYSYTSYLAATGKLEKWVDSGTGHIKHREFADYLRWIGSHFSKQIISGEVINIQNIAGNWAIDYTNQGLLGSVECSGVVMTGPGKAVNPFDIEVDNQVVFDGKDWWQFQHLFQDSTERIALVGGGISAGSIFENLFPKLGKTSHLDWYTRKGLMTRSENFANNQRFSIAELWQQIPPEQREQFATLTDRGSLDSGTHTTMSSGVDRFGEVIGTIHSIHEIDGKIEINYKDGVAEKQRLYDKVIIAAGFDRDAFVELFDAESQKKLHKLDLLRSIEPDLSVKDVTPRLQLPMHSWFNVGVGCATLGCTSTMADRILSAWVQKSPMLDETSGVKIGKGGAKGDALFATKSYKAGDTVVEGYVSKFSNGRTPTSVQIGIDMHGEPSMSFVKANHSCEPNCGLKLNELGGYSLVAMKSIPANEEITWDYAMSEWESMALESTTCKCNAKKCREKIGGYKHLSPELRQKYSGFTAPYLTYML